MLGDKFSSKEIKSETSKQPFAVRMNVCEGVCVGVWVWVYVACTFPLCDICLHLDWVEFTASPCHTRGSLAAY